MLKTKNVSLEEEKLKFLGNIKGFFFLRGILVLFNFCEFALFKKVLKIVLNKDFPAIIYENLYEKYKLNFRIKQYKSVH